MCRSKSAGGRRCLSSDPLYRRTRNAAMKAGASAEEARAEALAAVAERDAREALAVLANQEGKLAAEVEAWLASVTEPEAHALSLAGYVGAGERRRRRLTERDLALLDEVAVQEGLGARPVPPTEAGSLRSISIAPIGLTPLPSFQEDEIAEAEPDAAHLLDALMASQRVPRWDPVRGLGLAWQDADDVPGDEQRLHRESFRDLLADWLIDVFGALVRGLVRWRQDQFPSPA